MSTNILEIKVNLVLVAFPNAHKHTSRGLRHLMSGMVS